MKNKQQLGDSKRGSGNKPKSPDRQEINTNPVEERISKFENEKKVLNDIVNGVSREKQKGRQKITQLKAEPKKDQDYRKKLTDVKDQLLRGKIGEKNIAKENTVAVETQTKKLEKKKKGEEQSLIGVQMEITKSQLRIKALKTQESKEKKRLARLTKSSRGLGDLRKIGQGE